MIGEGVRLSELKGCEWGRGTSMPRWEGVLSVFIAAILSLEDICLVVDEDVGGEAREPKLAGVFFFESGSCSSTTTARYKTIVKTSKNCTRYRLRSTPLRLLVPCAFLCPLAVLLLETEDLNGHSESRLVTVSGP